MQPCSGACRRPRSKGACRDPRRRAGRHGRRQRPVRAEGFDVFAPHVQIQERVVVSVSVVVSSEDQPVGDGGLEHQRDRVNSRRASSRRATPSYSAMIVGRPRQTSARDSRATPSRVRRRDAVPPVSDAKRPPFERNRHASNVSERVEDKASPHVRIPGQKRDVRVDGKRRRLDRLLR